MASVSKIPHYLDLKKTYCEGYIDFVAIKIA